MEGGGSQGEPKGNDSLGVQEAFRGKEELAMRGSSHSQSGSWQRITTGNLNLGQDTLSSSGRRAFPPPGQGAEAEPPTEFPRDC